MEKATWTLGAVIIVLILISVVITGKPTATTKAPAQQPVKKEAPAPAKQSTPAASTTTPAQVPAAPAK